MMWFAATLALLLQLSLVCWFDFTKMIIPNILNLSLLLSGLVVRYVIFDETPLSAVIRPLIVYCIFWVVAKLYAELRGRQGLGRGDIKFLAASSIWIELVLLPWLVLIGSTSGLAYGIIAGTSRQNIQSGARLPFGPHLALGFIATWLMLHYWEI